MSKVRNKHDLDHIVTHIDTLQYQQSCIVVIEFNFSYLKIKLGISYLFTRLHVPVRYLNRCYLNTFLSYLMAI